MEMFLSYSPPKNTTVSSFENACFPRVSGNKTHMWKTRLQVRYVSPANLSWLGAELWLRFTSLRGSQGFAHLHGASHTFSGWVSFVCARPRPGHPSSPPSQSLLKLSLEFLHSEASLGYSPWCRHSVGPWRLQMCWGIVCMISDQPQPRLCLAPSCWLLPAPRSSTPRHGGVCKGLETRLFAARTVLPAF